MPKLTKNTPMNLSLRCPNCGDVARCRTTRDVSPLYREAYFVCRQLACGLEWKAAIEFLYVVRPSVAPTTGIFLPSAPTAVATVPQPPANDRGPEVPPPPPANDDDEAIAAAL